ncbi:MAG: hypothetical protein ACKO34_05710 [Vampirovibrionales bacterium]
MIILTHCFRFLTYHVTQFIPTLIILVLIYPWSHAVLAPLWSMVFPLSHASLGKVLTIYTLFYWLPVVFRLAWQCLRYRSSSIA